MTLRFRHSERLEISFQGLPKPLWRGCSESWRCGPISLAGRDLASHELVIELADLPGHPARTIARRHKAQLEDCLADLLARSGVKRAKELARAVWLLSEGAISLILVHGDRGYSAAASEAAMMLVQQYTSEQIISGRSNR